MFLSTNGFTLVRFQIIHIQPLKFIRFALEYNLQLITFVTIYMVQNVRLVTRSSRFLFSFNFKVTDLASQSFTCLLALLSYILAQNLGKANNEFLLNSCIPFLFFVYYFCRKTWQIYVVFHS